MFGTGDSPAHHHVVVLVRQRPAAAEGDKARIAFLGQDGDGQVLATKNGPAIIEPSQKICRQGGETVLCIEDRHNTTSLSLILRGSHEQLEQAFGTHRRQRTCIPT